MAQNAAWAVTDWKTGRQGHDRAESGRRLFHGCGMSNVKARVYQILDRPEKGDTASKVVDGLLMALEQD